jgi:adenine specific DNA methylase Mod
MNTNGKPYGPANPHPLSQLRTELIWEGKYDEYGNRREVDVAGHSLPMQKIETIDQPRSEAAAAGQLEMFERKTKRVDDFRNMLIWGDNKLVMASLLKEFKGRVDLIYIDPPFDVGADFTMDVPMGDGKDTLEKDQSTLEMVAYRDTWGKDVDSYLHMMFERFALMRDLLSDDGSIVVHCDWHVNFQLRSLLSEVFEVDRFKNEIVWYYYNKMQGNVNRFAANHDTLLWYSKGRPYHFYQQQEQREEAVQQLKRVWDKEAGKLVNAKDEEGRVIYIEATERTVDDVWRIPMLQPADKTENVGYATQKPIELAGRIIDALTAPGDLILDAFAGAERRLWQLRGCARRGTETIRRSSIQRRRGGGSGVI